MEMEISGMGLSDIDSIATSTANASNQAKDDVFGDPVLFFTSDSLLLGSSPRISGSATAAAGYNKSPGDDEQVSLGSVVQASLGDDAQGSPGDGEQAPPRRWRAGLPGVASLAAPGIAGSAAPGRAGSAAPGRAGSAAPGRAGSAAPGVPWEILADACNEVDADIDDISFNLIDDNEDLHRSTEITHYGHDTLLAQCFVISNQKVNEVEQILM
ncbi:UNVERIFIED_CONTAM: hypothetical protein FKN15_065370 [Acipenser sinensis]